MFYLRGVMLIYPLLIALGVQPVGATASIPADVEVNCEDASLLKCMGIDNARCGKALMSSFPQCSSVIDQVVEMNGGHASRYRQCILRKFASESGVALDRMIQCAIPVSARPPGEFEMQVFAEDTQEQKVMDEYNTMADRFGRIPSHRQREIYQRMQDSREPPNMDYKTFGVRLGALVQKLKALGPADIKIVGRYVQRLVMTEIQKQLLIGNYEIKAPDELHVRESIRLEAQNEMLAATINGTQDADMQELEALHRSQSNNCKSIASLNEKIEAETIPLQGKHPEQQRYEQQLNSAMSRMQRAACTLSSSQGGSDMPSPPDIEAKPQLTQAQVYQEQTAATAEAMLSTPDIPLDEYRKAESAHLHAYDNSARVVCMRVWHERTQTPVLKSLESIADRFDADLQRLNNEHEKAVETLNKTQGKEMRELTRAKHDNDNNSLQCTNLPRQQRRPCYEPHMRKREALTQRIADLRKTFDKQDAALGMTYQSRFEGLVSSKNRAVRAAAAGLGAPPPSTHSCWKQKKLDIKLADYDPRNSGPRLNSKLSQDDISFLKWMLKYVAFSAVDKNIISPHLAKEVSQSLRFRDHAKFIDNDSRRENFCDGLEVFRTAANFANISSPQSAGGKINAAFTDVAKFLTQGRGCR